MLNRIEILSFLRENKDLFQKQYGIRKIGLFGSYARGEETDQSDVDILIEMSSDPENIFDKRLQLKDALIRHFAKNVDVCHERAIKPVFRELIFKDAIYAW
jgi:predicted nucleotidyltransferase